MLYGEITGSIGVHKQQRGPGLGELPHLCPTAWSWFDAPMYEEITWHFLPFYQLRGSLPVECRLGLSIHDGCHGLSMFFSVSKLGCRRKKCQNLKERAEMFISGRPERCAELGVASSLLCAAKGSAPCPCLGTLLVASSTAPSTLWSPLAHAPYGSKQCCFSSQTFLLTHPVSGKRLVQLWTKNTSYVGRAFAHFGKGAENTKEWETASETHYSKCCI